MKRFLLFGLVFVLVGQAWVAWAAPGRLAISEEGKQRAEEALKEATGEETQEEIDKAAEAFELEKEERAAGIGTAALSLQNVITNINTSNYFVEQQKAELVKPVTELKQSVIVYKERVEVAVSKEEIDWAYGEFSGEAQAGLEKLAGAAVAVEMISVGGSFGVAGKYFETAENASGALKFCGLDTSEVNEMIGKGRGQLGELQAAYDRIMEDGAVSSEEQKEASETAELMLEMATNIAEITEVNKDLVSKCPWL